MSWRRTGEPSILPSPQNEQARRTTQENSPAGPQGRLIRRPKSKWPARVRAPSGKLPGATCACPPGGSMPVRQRLLRLAPALTFLLLNLLDRKSVV